MTEPTISQRAQVPNFLSLAVRMATSVDLRLRGINVSTQRRLPRTKRRKDQNDQGLFDFIYVLGDDAREEAREVEKSNNCVRTLMLSSERRLRLTEEKVIHAIIFWRSRKKSENARKPKLKGRRREGQSEQFGRESCSCHWNRQTHHLESLHTSTFNAKEASEVSLSKRFKVEGERSLRVSQ